MKIVKGKRRIVLYNTRHATVEHSIFPCCVSCDKCPFRFKCLTTRDIMMVSELEYTDKCHPNPYSEVGNIRLVAMGTQWNPCRFNCDECQKVCYV